MFQSGISLPAHLKKVSEEGKEKRRQARFKAVSQYTGEGKFVRSFKSITEAAETTGTRPNSISSCIAGRYKSAGGFIWRLGTSQKPLSKKQVNLFQNRKYHKPQPIARYDQENNLIKIYPSMTKAASAIGINRKSLSAYLVKNDKVFYNGDAWCFLELKKR